MSPQDVSTQLSPFICDAEYVDYVVSRARKQNFRAEEKLRNLDDLAEMIFIARKNYQGSKDKEA